MSHVHHHSKPMLVDNSLNRAYSIKYLIYALFGVSGVIAHVPSMAAVAGEAVASTIAGIIAFTGFFSAFYAWNFLKSERNQRRELYWSIATCTFLAVYSANLIYLAFTGSTDRINLAVISIGLLVMPIWRHRWILKRGRRS